MPLEFDDDQQRYYLNGGFLLPATNFSPQEASALLIVCNELGDRAGLPFHGPARAAAAKLESTLPPRLRDYLREASASVRIRLEPNNRLAEHEEIYRRLLDATVSAQGRANQLRQPGRSQATPNPARSLPAAVQPTQLVCDRPLQRASRRADVQRRRIRRLEQPTDRFKTPRGFTIEGYLGNAWHLVNERGPDRDVTIRFQKLVAQNVAEVVWHKTQRLEFLPDGSLDFHVRVSGLNEISWWILGYGDQARVVKPVALRNWSWPAAAGC